ncbi:MAG: cytidylate kinase-like family protein [Deltaproteobacteria bacterium]|nr:cytidylate kinase-like family protein [Deltaproteobacteria bacterium]
MAILSISREYQSGGEEIGQAIANKLDYVFVDKERILKDLKDSGGKWGHLVEELDEVRPSLWEKYDWQYQGFTALIECYIYDYALKDRVVILGRGSIFLLQAIPHVLKVRLVAPLEVRINRVMVTDDVDRETAEWLIQKTDRTRAGYIQAVFGKQWEAREHYDFVFDTGVETYEEVTRKLVEALKEWEQRVTPEGLEQLKNLALTAKIKARVFTHPGIFIPTLKIFHDGQAVVLTGVVHSPKEYHLVDEMVHKMADPHPIRNELHYRK